MCLAEPMTKVPIEATARSDTTAYLRATLKAKGSDAAIICPFTETYGEKSEMTPKTGVKATLSKAEGQLHASQHAHNG